MANFINQLKNIQLVFRRSSNARKILVAVFILFGIAALFVLQGATAHMRAQNAALENQAAQLEQDNTELRGDIDALGSVQSVEEIAQEELGLVSPDTVLIQPGD